MQHLKSYQNYTVLTGFFLDFFVLCTIFCCISLPPTKEKVHFFAHVFVCLFVCLSVCLLARLLENACMDFDEMLCVDRCRDMDLSGRLTLKPDPDHSPDARGTELLSPISYMRCYA